MRKLAWMAVSLSVLAALAAGQASKKTLDLQTYFKQSVGLTDDQVAQIRGGQAFAKAMPSRTPAEIIVWGAVYVKATPDSYLKFSSDYDRLAKMPGYVAIRKISTPPQPADFKGFDADKDDIHAMKDCKPGDCDVQMPASSMEDFQKSIDWSAPDVDVRVNQLAQKKILEGVTAYQSQGNAILGVYNDKDHPTVVPDQFKYILSYSKVLPNYLPAFYNYLLTYPKGKPANVEDTFYWAKVSFGLKPTLRVVHVVTLRGKAPGEPAYAIAEKQLYSNHYFQTALDVTFCISDAGDPTRPGFYMIKAMGSEQAGLTGFKGSIVRKVAVGRSASSLEKSLAAIKGLLEQTR